MCRIVMSYVICAAAVLSMATQVSANEWTNTSGNGNWNTAANWNTGVVPTVTTDNFGNIQINLTGANACTVSGAPEAVGEWMHIGNLADGTLNVGAGGVLGQPIWGPGQAWVGEVYNGVVNVDGAGSVCRAEQWNIGSATGTGTVNITNGGQFIGVWWGNYINSTGRINIISGTMVILGGGDFVIQPGGVIDIDGTSTLTLDDNRKSLIDTYIAAGQITGNGIVGNVTSTFNGSTTVVSVKNPVTPGVVSIKNVTAASEDLSGQLPAINTINGSGMTGDYHDMDYHHMWLTVSGGGATNPNPGTEPGATWIRYDFNSLCYLTWMRVWNYNGDPCGDVTSRGLKNVTIEYTSDDVTWHKLDNYVFSKATHTTSYLYNTTVWFSNALAKSVVITAKGGVGTGNWGATDALYGLSEVRFNGTAYIYPYASNPNPFDGTTGLIKATVLSWRPGTYAANENGHDVYLGTDYNSVANANHSSDEFMGRQSATSYDPCSGLEFGQSYYWRIDEVNDPCVWRGSVWTFQTAPAEASNPSPADGAIKVSTGSKLNWTAGGAAISHDVYFGTDYNSVADANHSSPEFKGSQSGTVFDPCTLEPGQIYYWRVDEVNSPNLWKGDVWSFTVRGPVRMVLGRGITLDRQFNQILSKSNIPFVASDIQIIKSMGFEFVKLLFNPACFISGSTINSSNMWYLEEMVNTVLCEGLPVVVCIHPEPDFKYTYLGSGGANFPALLSFYHDFAAYMAARWDTNELVFQLMTEPFANPLYTSWNNIWPSMLTSVRSAMPNHTLIMSGDQSGIIEGMVNDVNPDLTTDQNILWSFTTYYPYIFTFQGGGFAGGYYPYLNNLPYPSSTSNDPADYILGSIPSGSYNDAYNAVNAYCDTPWNLTKHRSILQPITNWQNAHPTSHPKVWCAEWGSLDRVQGNSQGGGCNPAERIQFIHDRRQALEERGISWAFWSYNETFTVLEPTVRIPGGKTPSYSWIDTTTLHALGLLRGDIAPAVGDGTVDYLDLAELAAHWLETSSSPDWNPACDLAPRENPDGVVNFLDFAVVAEHWRDNIVP